MSQPASADSIRVESDRLMFELENGKVVKLPPSYGTIHDEEGVYLPRCEVFFGAYKKTSQPAKMSRSHRRYFGADHKAKLARLPKIPIDGWKEVGKVSKILYVRKGTRAPGGFHHPFTFNGSHRPILYKQGRLYKLSLGEGCLVDDRGYRFP
jgi:hypothetical protein